MRNPFVAPTISRAFLDSDMDNVVSDVEIFPFLRLPNGTFKTTEAGRMVDVDELLIAILGRENRDYDILDVACSSGTCTSELSAMLRKHGIQHRLFASDLYLYARRLFMPPFTILYCEDSFVLQVDIGPCAFPNTPPSRLSACVFAIAKRLVGFGRVVGLPGVPVRLLSSVARKVPIAFSDGDVFGEIYRAEPERRFDVIRVANLLHTNYFTEDQIKQAIANLKLYLRPGGYLMLVRSEHEINKASVYRLRDSRWESVGQRHDSDEFAKWMGGLAWC